MKRIVRNILINIQKHNYQAYVVGGYVRDYLLKRPTYDIDIATSAPLNILKNIFPNSQINEFYSSLKFKIDKYNIEITTFRTETYNPNLTINYTDSILLDAKRRDFTINALYMDSKGHIIDPLKGIKDLNNKTLKVIGDVDTRLKEDPLRILRALRFSLELNFTLESSLNQYIMDNKELLTKISYFHRKNELTKLLTHQSSINNLYILKQMNILPYLEIDFDTLTFTNNILGMWSQINFSTNYPFTNQEKKLIKKLREYSPQNPFDLYNLGIEYSLVLAEIHSLNPSYIKHIYKHLPIKSKKDIKIDYSQLHKLGYQDKEINDIINYIEEQILLNKLKNNYQSIKHFLKQNWR